MDVTPKTPVAVGRQGADSWERPIEVQRSDSELHF
jgi:hypothetical protein